MDKKDIERYLKKVNTQLKYNRGNLILLLLRIIDDPTIVKIPINFVYAANNRVQPRKQERFDDMEWANNVPRIAISEDGVPLIMYIPRLTGLNATVSIYIFLSMDSKVIKSAEDTYGTSTGICHNKRTSHWQDCNQ